MVKGDRPLKILEASDVFCVPRGKWLTRGVFCPLAWLFMGMFVIFGGTPLLWMDKILHHLRIPGMIRFPRKYQQTLWFQPWFRTSCGASSKGRHTRITGPGFYCFRPAHHLASPTLQGASAHLHHRHHGQQHRSREKGHLGGPIAREHEGNSNPLLFRVTGKTVLKWS